MEEIKNKVYELEGLLELADMREDKQTALWPLISQRIRDISDLWSQLSPAAPQPELHEDESNDVEEEEIAGIDHLDANNEKIDWTQQPIANDDENATTMSESFEPQSIADDTNVSEPLEQQSDTDETTISEPLEQQSDTDETTISKPLEQHPEVVIKREKLKLCLNDRFRYSRLLTGGDNKKLDNLLERLSVLADEEEAREYLLGEYDLDPEDSEVADFFDLLTAYYS